jgi:hypothetical protein
MVVGFILYKQVLLALLSHIKVKDTKNLFQVPCMPIVTEYIFSEVFPEPMDNIGVIPWDNIKLLTVYTCAHCTYIMTDKFDLSVFILDQYIYALQL